MRSTVRTTLSLLALALCMALSLAAAQADGFPDGTFVAEAKGHKWSLSFKSGKFTVSRDEVEGVQGTYKVSGDQITMTDTDGPGAQKGEAATGVYGWSYARGALTFTLVKDSGGGRAAVLTSGPFTKK